MPKKISEVSLGEFVPTEILGADNIFCTLEHNYLVNAQPDPQDKNGLVKIKEPKPSESAKPHEYGAWHFQFSDLLSEQPRLNGYPYRKVDMGDSLLLVASDSAAMTFLINKKTGAVVETKVLKGGSENVAASTFVGHCRKAP